jgi:RNA recognition motif-containing protein
MRQNKFRGNVFVKNLPSDLTEAELASLFDPHGLVLGVFIARDPATGASKRFALVDIAPAREADKTVAALNGMEIGDRKIDVRLADPEMAINVPSSPCSSQRHYRGVREPRSMHETQIRRVPTTAR